jgi:hypothetical protein
MEIIRLDHLPCVLDCGDLMQRLHVRSGSADAKDLAALVREAETIANPRAVYGAAFISAHEEDMVFLEDVRFDSRVLSVNLMQVERVFPFVATCGMELQEWAERIDDMIWQFWAEAIKEDALRSGISGFQNHLQERYRPGHLSTMSPGSLESWPITQQAPLFGLLGHPAEVKLTESMLMIPSKSVSGISFPTEGNFESCQLCPRQNCPGRRAPYDETLYARAYCPSSD